MLDFDKFIKAFNGDDLSHGLDFNLYIIDFLNIDLVYETVYSNRQDILSHSKLFRKNTFIKMTDNETIFCYMDKDILYVHMVFREFANSNKYAYSVNCAHEVLSIADSGSDKYNIFIANLITETMIPRTHFMDDVIGQDFIINQFLKTNGIDFNKWQHIYKVFLKLSKSENWFPSDNLRPLFEDYPIPPQLDREILYPTK